jgi:hypothetical protein
MTDDGDEIAMAPCLDADDAEAVVAVLVGHALDKTGEHLSVCGCGLGLNRHEAIYQQS